MESIKSLLSETQNQPSGIIRFKYMPYSMNICKHVWFGFAKKHIGDNKLTVGATQANVWTELIKYIHGDEDCGYDLNKSVCLIGKTGAGKSMTMEIINKYIEIDNVMYARDGRKMPFKFSIVTSREIVSEYQSKGYDGISKYLVIGNLCIDDLGSEPEMSNHYGAKLDVITEVIEARYSKGLMTHFTSNLNEELIKERYNDRVYSRILHQCNMIIMNDKDFRIDGKQD